MSSSSASFQPEATSDVSNTSEQQQQQTQQVQQPPQPKLVDIEVKDEVIALNLLVSFLNLAQRRGAFSIDESSKIWECIKKFQKQ
jgi:hypothetical protein